MSDEQKYRLFHFGYIAGLPLSAFCFSQIYKAGAAHPTQMKLWFVVLVTVVLICSGCGIAYYYLRSKLKQPEVSDTAIKALSSYGEQIKHGHDSQHSGQ